MILFDICMSVLILAPTAVLPHLSLLVMLKAVILTVSLHYVDRFLHGRLNLIFLRFLAGWSPIPFGKVVEVFSGFCEEYFLLHVLRVHVRFFLIISSAELCANA